MYFTCYTMCLKLKVNSTSQITSTIIPPLWLCSTTVHVVIQNFSSCRNILLPNTLPQHSSPNQQYSSQMSHRTCSPQPVALNWPQHARLGKTLFSTPSRIPWRRCQSDGLRLPSRSWHNNSVLRNGLRTWFCSPEQHPKH